ncbi:MAG: acyltransferase [Deltaproteobacteria bacterium]|nr:acyltransferase [Deltaproteobacteria bacterium]
MNRVKAKNSTATIKRVSSQAELVQALTIRILVFVREQGVPAEIELDTDDQRAIHFLAIKLAKAVGTARVVMRRGDAKIGRMAVLKSYRRKGIGAALLKRAILSAKRLHARRIYLHAQVAVIGFYQRMGFRAVGRVFDEAGIAHRKMILRGE